MAERVDLLTPHGSGKEGTRPKTPPLPLKGRVGRETLRWGSAGDFSKISVNTGRGVGRQGPLCKKGLEWGPGTSEHEGGASFFTVLVRRGTEGVDAVLGRNFFFL